MRKIFFICGWAIFAIMFTQCKKGSDYYYAAYLNNAETAKPAKVDSLQIFPGYNRAMLQFKILPDRRVKKVAIYYTTSLSADIQTFFFPVLNEEYGKYKVIELNNIPEATIFVNAVSFNEKGDSSNTTETIGTIYGERYSSALTNRIYKNITTVGNIKRINFLNESGKPIDSSGAVFYPLQKTIITYPTASGDSSTVEISPYTNFINVPDIAGNGTIKHRSLYKPVENAVDVFYSREEEVTF